MEKKNGSGKRTVKDLPTRKGQEVKGGTINTASSALMKACATGVHFKEPILHG